MKLKPEQALVFGSFTLGLSSLTAIAGYFVGKSFGIFMTERKFDASQKLNEALGVAAKAVELYEQGQTYKAMMLLSEYNSFFNSMNDISQK